MLISTDQYTNTHLRSLFEPAYRPCPHFNDVCKGICIWKLERGPVPRGFGGATASHEVVRLVIVAAEPGRPGDHERYSGTEEDKLFFEPVGPNIIHEICVKF